MWDRRGGNVNRKCSLKNKNRARSQKNEESEKEKVVRLTSFVGFRMYVCPCFSNLFIIFFIFVCNIYPLKRNIYFSEFFMLPILMHYPPCAFCGMRNSVSHPDQPYRSFLILKAQVKALINAIKRQSEWIILSWINKVAENWDLLWHKYVYFRSMEKLWICVPEYCDSVGCLCFLLLDAIP